MIQKKGRPITGAKPRMRPTPNVLTDQARTSQDLQRRVNATPQPFQSPNSATQSPTGRVRYSGLGIEYEKTSTGTGKNANYGSKVGCANTSLSASEMAAIGYSANATRGPRDNPIISGQPLSGQSRRSGPSSQPVVTHTPPRASGFASGRTPAAETGRVPGDARGTRNFNSPNSRIIGGKMTASSPGHPVRQGMHAHGTPITNKGSRRRP